MLSAKDVQDEVSQTLDHYTQGGRPDPRTAPSAVSAEREGMGQQVLRWLRGDPKP